MKKERIFYLDFIRALSIFLVVIFHFNIRYRLLNPDGASYFIGPSEILGLEPGHLGVSLFLIVSGASLMYTYQENFHLKDFFRRRFLAIYPMFWLAYAVAAVFTVLTRGFRQEVPLYRFLYTIMGMDGIAHSVVPTFYLLGEWFLGLIILCYLLFPLLLKGMNRHPVILACLAVSVYLLFAFWYPFSLPQNYFLPVRIPEFLFGMYFIRYWKKISLRQAGLALAGAVIFSLPQTEAPLGMEMLKIPLAGVFCFLILAWIGEQITQPSLRKVFSVGARYSYAVCLVHHVVLTQILTWIPLEDASYIKFCGVFLLTLLVIAAGSFCLYQINKFLLSYFTSKGAKNSSYNV